MADPVSFIASWFTPSTPFIFVILVIGTIAITSRFPKNQPQPLLQRLRSFSLGHHNHHEPSSVAHTESTHPQLVRTPSLLERLSSLSSLGRHNHYEASSVAQTECTQPQLVQTPSLLERLRSFSSLGHYNHYEESSAAQTECTQPQLVRTPSLLERVRSFNLGFYKHEPSTHAETQYAEPEPENPELVGTPSRLYRSEPIHGKQEDGDSEAGKMRKWASEKAKSEDEGRVGDEEVDAKADVFIKRFKKQLRLQRLDSIFRYREMLN